MGSIGHLTAQFIQHRLHSRRRAGERDLFNAGFAMDAEAQLCLTCGNAIFLWRAGHGAGIKAGSDRGHRADHFLGCGCHVFQ